MPSIQEQLERLTGKKRGKGRLKPAAARGAIPADTVTVYPSASSPGGAGVAWPLVEQPYTGSTFYSLRSSDGFIVFEYGHTTTYQDGSGELGDVQHLDYT